MTIEDGILFGLGFWGIAWALIGVFVIGVMADIEDFFIAPVLAFLIYVAGLELLFDVPVLHTILDHPLTVFAFLAGYVVLGASFTGFWKYPDLLDSKSEDTRKNYNSFLRQEDYDDTPESKEVFMKDTYYNKMHPSNWKAQLSTWVLLWPFVLLVDLMHRPAKWVWNTGYKVLGQWFDSIMHKKLDRSLKGEDKS